MDHEGPPEAWPEKAKAAWDMGYNQGCQEPEAAIPPFLLRRLFWWDKKSLSFPWKPLYWSFDEYCNRVLGLRVWNGVLFVRTARTVRLTPHPACAVCHG